MFISPLKHTLLLLLCLCAQGVTHADTTPDLPQLQPPLHQSVYSVKKFGTTLGEMTNEFRREEDGLHYTSRLEASGLAALFISEPITEHSLLQQGENGDLQQLGYTLNNPEKKRKNETISFSNPVPDETRVNASYRNKEKTIHATTDTFSRQLLPLLMSRDLLRNSEQPRNQFQIIEKAKLEHYSYQRLNEDTVRYNGKSLSALKFRIDKQDSDSYSYVWLAEATDYLPLKIDQYQGDKLQARLLLTHYTRTQ
jgi:hypothetical protein